MVLQRLHDIYEILAILPEYIGRRTASLLKILFFFLTCIVSYLWSYYLLDIIIYVLQMFDESITYAEAGPIFAFGILITPTLIGVLFFLPDSGIASFPSQRMAHMDLMFKGGITKSKLAEALRHDNDLHPLNTSPDIIESETRIPFLGIPIVIFLLLIPGLYAILNNGMWFPSEAGMAVFGVVFAFSIFSLPMFIGKTIVQHREFRYWRKFWIRYWLTVLAIFSSEDSVRSMKYRRDYTNMGTTQIYPQDREKRRESDKRDFFLESLKERIPLSESQRAVLSDISLRALVSEYNLGAIPIELSHILSSGGEEGYHGELDTALQINPYWPLGGNTNPHSVLVKLLTKGRVFRDGEVPLFHDRGSISVVKTNVSRYGTIILTNQRLLVMGFQSYYMETGHRLSYGPRWKTEPWLNSLDYIELDLLGEGKVMGNRARFMCETKYIKTIKREFYGPLWIRFPLPTRHSFKKGRIKLFIEAEDLHKAFDLPNSEAVPKDDAVRRIGAITGKIRRIQGEGNSVL